MRTHAFGWRFCCKYRCAAAPHSYPTKHHIYTAIQSGFELQNCRDPTNAGPYWAHLKKPSDFFLGPYSHTMSYNIWLVVEPYPLKNDGVKVSWAYDIPNMMGK